MVALLAFFASGRYMRVEGHGHWEGQPALHMLYLSRHIYILATALVAIALSAYVTPLPDERWRRVQWLASGLVVAAVVLEMAAFVVEPVWGQGRTRVSAYGVYTLFGGTLLHALASVAGRRGSKTADA